ncbi:MAG TPA: hypothetical protein VI731_02790 [Bacteroidia bacterium]|nr:hypothetical protein [Bacteroidia bacterium]
MKNTAAILILLFLFVSCSSEIDHAYIKARTWVHHDGFKLDGEPGFEFTSGIYELKGDTIYSGSQPKAVVTALFKNDNLLKIKSLSDGETGKYLDAIEFAD